MQAQKQKLILEAGRSDTQYWTDLWRYRELFLFLAWRDILVRYKQTVLGLAWALLRPLLIMLVFTFVFGKLAKFPSEGIPYPLLVFSALMPWQFFASSVSAAGESLVNHAGMITKVYFPRLLIPTSAVMVSFVDFLVSGLILIVMMTWYGVTPNIRILLLPVFVMMTFIAALGLGLWVASLTVKYRDFRILIPFIIQIGLYITPVGFSSNIVPEHLRFIYSLNPMVGVIDGFRWALMGDGTDLYWPGEMISFLLIAIVFISGVIHFRKTEKSFADVI